MEDWFQNWFQEAELSHTQKQKIYAALADWTQVKSGQEEEPDPEDQAMLGQSLGSIQVLTRTYTWKMMTVRRVLVPLFQGLGRALVPDNKKDY